MAHFLLTCYLMLNNGQKAHEHLENFYGFAWFSTCQLVAILLEWEE